MFCCNQGLEILIREQDEHEFSPLFPKFALMAWDLPLFWSHVSGNIPIKN